MARAALLVALALGGSCGGGELDALVVPGELPAEELRGEDGQGLGSCLAWGSSLLVGAPGTGELLLWPEGSRWQGPRGLGAWCWWEGEEPRAARAGDGVYALGAGGPELLFSAPGARAFAGGLLGGEPVELSVDAGGATLWRDGERAERLELEGLRRAQVGRDRILLLRCGDSGDCAVLSWCPGEEPIELGEAGEGSGLAEREGLALWGLPELDDDRGGGRVCAEDGSCVEGEPGDHLGRSVTPCFAAGVFNPLEIPAVGRVVPLAGGSPLAVERGIEDHALLLAEADDGPHRGMLALGQPAFPSGDGTGGRVLLVERSEAIDRCLEAK